MANYRHILRLLTADSDRIECLMDASEVSYTCEGFTEQGKAQSRLGGDVSSELAAPNSFPDGLVELKHCSTWCGLLAVHLNSESW